MANIWEKDISILSGNLNSGLSYLITTEVLKWKNISQKSFIRCFWLACENSEKYYCAIAHAHTYICTYKTAAFHQYFLARPMYHA